MCESWHDVLLIKFYIIFTPDLTGHTQTKRLNFCHFSQSLGIFDMFLSKREVSLCFYLSEVALTLELPRGGHFCSMFFLLLSHEHRPCSSLDVILGSLVISWMRVTVAHFWEGSLLFPALSICG